MKQLPVLSSNAFYRHSLIGDLSFYVPNVSNVDLFLARQLSRVEGHE